MMGTMNVRLADPCDQPAAEAMLRAGFGDEDWFLRAFFGCVWQRCDTLISTQDGIPAAMAALLPCGVYRENAEITPACYLYALSTLPAFRGRGHAKGLLQAAQQRCECVFLHAESDSLHAWYHRLGWQDAMHAKRLILPALPGDAPMRADADAYYAARERLLRGTAHIVWGKDLCAFAAQMLACEGGGLYANDHAACAVTGIQDGCLMLCEALGDLFCAQRLAGRLGCKCLSVLIPCARGDIALSQAVGAPLPEPLHMGFDFD